MQGDARAGLAVQSDCEQLVLPSTVRIFLSSSNIPQDQPASYHIFDAKACHEMTASDENIRGKMHPEFLDFP